MKKVIKKEQSHSAMTPTCGNSRCKRLLLLLFTLHASLFTLCAQTIQKGDRFFDGDELFIVQEVRMGEIVYMVSNYDNELTLKKVKGKAGEYTFEPSRQADEPPFRGTSFGQRVQYVRQDGMNFLAFRKKNGDAMYVMLLTPDNFTHLEQMQSELDFRVPSDVINNTLLNVHYLDRMDRYALKIARNEILARHGYRFKSEDLMHYFCQQPWYRPGNNNADIRLNIIEQTNVELIKSQEAVPFGQLPCDNLDDMDQSDVE